MSKTTWNRKCFDNFKCYDMHQNWGLITQILTDNRDKVNKLLYEVKRKSDKEFGNKRKKLIIKQGETLTPIGLNLVWKNSFEEFSDELVEYALDKGEIPAELLDEYNEWQYIGTDEEDALLEFDERTQDESFATYLRIREKIFDTIGFNKNDYLPVKWMPYGRCHWYHPIIGMYLARKLMPDGKWEEFQTEGHTTIYSAKYKLLFDLLAWGCLNAEASTYNMLFGNEYKPATDEEFLVIFKGWLEQ